MSLPERPTPTQLFAPSEAWPTSVIGLPSTTNDHPNPSYPHDSRPPTEMNGDKELLADTVPSAPILVNQGSNGGRRGGSMEVGKRIEHSDDNLGAGGRELDAVSKSVPKNGTWGPSSFRLRSSQDGTLPPINTLNGHVTVKRERKRSSSSQRENGTDTGTSATNTPSSTSASSSFFPLFGSKSKAAAITKNRAASSPKPSNPVVPAPDTTTASWRPPSRAASHSALRDPSSSSETSRSAGERPAERRLTYLKDVVALQKKDGRLPLTPDEKLLPPLPPGLGSFDPDGALHIPVGVDAKHGLSSLRPKIVEPRPQAGNADVTSLVADAVETQLDRDRTIRVRSKGKERESSDATRSETSSMLGVAPRLRPLKSLGIGKPSISREYSETSTIRLACSSNEPSTVSILHDHTAFTTVLDRNLSPASASNIRFAAGIPRRASDLQPSTDTGRGGDTTPQLDKRKTIKRASSFAGITRVMKFGAESRAISTDGESRDIASELRIDLEDDHAQETASPQTTETPPKSAGPGLFRGAAEWFGIRKSSKRSKAEEMDVTSEPIEVVLPPRPTQHANPVSIPRKAASTQATSSGWSFGGKAPEPLPTVNPGKRSRRSTLLPPSTPSNATSPDISPRTSSLARFDPFLANGSRTTRSAGHSPALPHHDLPMERRESEPTDVLPLIRTTSPTEGDFLDTLMSSASPGSSIMPMESPAGILTGLGLPDPIIDLNRPLYSRSESGRSSKALSDPPGKIYTTSPHPDGVVAVLALEEAPASRPTLGRRSNSANSTVLGRMKTAIGGRSRSGSLLRNIGDATFKDGDLISPSASTTSLLSSAPSKMSRHGSFDRAAIESPPLEPRFNSRFIPSRPQSYQSLAPAGQVNTTSGDDTHPRPSMSGSLASSQRSQPDSVQSRRHPTFLDPGEGSSTASSISGRARSSTLSAVNPSRMQSIAGSPNRKRPGSMRRLSTGFFGIGNPSESSSLFPLPPRTGDPSSPRAPSPMPSQHGGVSKSADLAKKARHKDPALQPQSDEVPADWVLRLLAVISRSDVANVLASSNDEHHTTALELFMDRFDFFDDALDVALRKLLMDIALPRETQQIDRVMEAFAKRYQRCQPGLFADPDHAYVLAFSLIMLHTDAFNKNNKNKMTKVDYVRNTKLDQVPPLILETFYDNICYTPFVFIEDDMDQPVEPYKNQVDTPVSTGSFLVLQQSQAQTAANPRSNKLDVYQMLTQGGLGILRLDISRVIPFEDPYTFLGTRPFYDHNEMQRVFASAPNLQVSESKGRRKSGATLITTDSGVVPGAVERDQDASKMNLKIIKVGLMSRKDDYVEGRRKASNRKWKSWSVILTGSQLVFFKDTTWALSLSSQIVGDGDSGEAGRQLYPRLTDFRPDEVYSLKSAAAVFDKSYSKYSNTFRLMLAQGRQFLLQVGDEYEMNEWISTINYASTYKTSAVRMRTPLEAAGNRVPSVNSRGAVPVQPTAHVAVPLLESKEFTGSKSSDSTVIAAETSSTHDMPPLDLRVRRGPSNGAGSRLHAVEAKVQELIEQAKPSQSLLSADLRVARNLSLLTPFQRATRERLEGAVPSLARRISETRLELAQLSCWRAILQADLDTYNRNRRGSRVVSRATNRTTDSMVSNGSLPSKHGEQSGTESDPRPSVETPFPPPETPAIMEQDEPESEDDEDEAPGAEVDGAELPVVFKPEEESGLTRPAGMERRASSMSFHTAWDVQLDEEDPVAAVPVGESEGSVVQPSWSGHGRKVSLAEVPPVEEMRKVSVRLKRLTNGTAAEEASKE